MDTLVLPLDGPVEDDLALPVNTLHGSDVNVGEEEKEYLLEIPVFVDQNIIWKRGYLFLERNLELWLLEFKYQNCICIMSLSSVIKDRSTLKVVFLTLRTVYLQFLFFL